MKRSVIAYMATGAGDWGGASRHLFVLLKTLDRKQFEPLVLFPKPGPILKTLEDMDIRYMIWPPHNYVQPWSYVAGIFLAAQLYKRNQVALVHINYGGFWRMAEVEAARILRIPTLAHLHLVAEHPGPSLRRCSLCIANSAYTAAASKLGRVPIEVVYNSVDLDRYDAAIDIRAELGLSPDDVVVTFAGQVREKKGVDIFIKAASLIPGSGVRFLIVGECRDKSRFSDAYTPESLNGEIAHDGRIRYIGYRSDIQNVYRSSDIVVMPSRWNEPFGLITIEAGASRRPVVAAAVGGVPEVVLHGETGFLFDRGDVDGFASYLQQLVESRDLRIRMGEAGRCHVERNFTTQPVRRLEQVYRRMIGPAL